MRMVGRDVRRLRPDIVFGGVEGLAERGWEGGAPHRRCGDLARLPARPLSHDAVDPDTLERDPEVLKDIVRRFRGRIALNEDVLRPGTVRVGDAVELVLPVAAAIDA